MNTIKLSAHTERLRPLIKDLLLYSGVTDTVIEVGEERSYDRGIFIDETKFDNLEDIMSEIALKLYNSDIHTKHLPSTEVWLSSKYKSKDAATIASVIEKAIHPDEFFQLERYRL